MTKNNQGVTWTAFAILVTVSLNVLNIRLFWRLSFNHLIVVDLHTLSSRTVFAHLDNIGDDDGQHDEKGGKLDETKIISHQSAFGPFTKPHLSSLGSLCMMLIVYVCLCLCMGVCGRQDYIR